MNGRQHISRLKQLKQKNKYDRPSLNMLMHAKLGFKFGLKIIEIFGKIKVFGTYELTSVVWASISSSFDTK